MSKADVLESPASRGSASSTDAVWKNWWRVLEDAEIECLDGVKGAVAGSRFASGAYPSKAAAERAASEVIVDNAIYADRLKYLGAYPEGVKP